MGEVESIKVKKGEGKLEFNSNKATDYEKNKISIEIKGSTLEFVKFDIKGDYFTIVID